MNSVILIGRLTKDVELRVTQSGKEVASFTLAVNQNFKNQNGEYEADFINCILYGNTAKITNQYCKKGDMIALSGRIQTRSYDAQDGTKRYVTEVIADKVTFLQTKPKEENNNLENMSNSQIIRNVMNEKTDPFKDFSNEIELSDDDLPF